MKRFMTVFLTLLIVGACSDQPEGPIEPMVSLSRAFGPEKVSPLTVMTWNVYVGALIEEILLTAPEQIPFKVAEIWQKVQATDFATRAEAIAVQIAEADPDIVGLQEISRYCYQSPGDWPLGPPAAEVVLDFLPILLEALQEQGLDYVPIAVTQNFDLEMPIVTATGLDDIRLTDYDVILARSDVEYANVQTGNFAVNIELPLTIPNPYDPANPLVVTIKITRGWASADICLHKTVFTFVTTHLEPDSPLVQEYQVMELLGILQNVDIPIVLVGDFNSPADLSGGPAYGYLLGAGFDDTWAIGGTGDGLTCCHVPGLDNPDASGFHSRIDLILTRGFNGADRLELFGLNPADRAANGLWPSDHAGLKAKVYIP